MKHTRKNRDDDRRGLKRFGPYGRACGSKNKNCPHCSANRTHKHKRRAPIE